MSEDLDALEGVTPEGDDIETPPEPPAPPKAVTPDDVARVQKALDKERKRTEGLERENRALQFAGLKATNPWLEESDLEGVSRDKWSEKVARLAQLAGTNANAAVPTLPASEAKVSDEERQQMAGVAAVAGGVAGATQPDAKTFGSNELLRMLKDGQISAAQMDQMVAQGRVKN